MEEAAPIENLQRMKVGDTGERPLEDLLEEAQVIAGRHRAPKMSLLKIDGQIRQGAKRAELTLANSVRRTPVRAAIRDVDGCSLDHALLFLVKPQSISTQELRGPIVCLKKPRHRLSFGVAE
jgi:hypothetical protein